MPRSFTRATSLAALAVVLTATARVACARGSASELEAAVRVVPDDTAAVARLLASARAIDPLLCELVVRQVDMHASWSHWGPLSGNPLEKDSSAAALIEWIQDEHTDPSVVPRLRDAMTDSDGCVRRVAGSFLGRVEHPAAVDALLSGLDEASAETRVVAAIGLGLSEKPRAVDPLVRRLGDQSAAVRRAAAWALGAIDDVAALLPLIDVLSKDVDPRVRQAAAWAIGEIDS